MAGEELKGAEGSLPLPDEDGETDEPILDDQRKSTEEIRPEELPPRRNRSAWFDL